MGFFTWLLDATNPFEAQSAAKEAADRFRLLDQFYRGEIDRDELAKRSKALGSGDEES